MPTYDIAGVPVDFPYDAYDVQLAYMEKVVLAPSGEGPPQIVVKFDEWPKVQETQLF